MAVEDLQVGPQMFSPNTTGLVFGRHCVPVHRSRERERESCHAGNIGFSYFHCYTLGIYYLLIHTHMRDDASDSFDCTLFEEEPSLGGSQAVSGNWWQSTRMNLH